MKYYEAKKGDRIDNITYEVYGNLDVLVEVLLANSHLSAKVLLESGDRVFLPIVVHKKIEKRGVSLW